MQKQASISGSASNLSKEHISTKMKDEEKVLK